LIFYVLYIFVEKMYVDSAVLMLFKSQPAQHQDRGHVFQI